MKTPISLTLCAKWKASLKHKEIERKKGFNILRWSAVVGLLWWTLHNYFMDFTPFNFHYWLQFSNFILVRCPFLSSAGCCCFRYCCRSCFFCPSWFLSLELSLCWHAWKFTLSFGLVRQISSNLYLSVWSFVRSSPLNYGSIYWAGYFVSNVNVGSTYFILVKCFLFVLFITPISFNQRHVLIQLNELYWVEDE